MTLIKPVKGLDDAMEESFRSIVAADPLKTLQVIVALESEDDPACPVARAFAARHPDRDILVAITGPSGSRMGKVHNMIEALPRAKHDRVLFSDADTCITAPLLADAARAFDEGADAVYAMPYHAEAPGLGGLWYMIAFNHAFCVPVALTSDLGQLRAFAGAFMGYKKSALARVGGLERFQNEIADDYSLGAAAREAGLRQVLLREPVFVSETGTGPGEAFRHIAKWSSIIFWSFPAGYSAVVLMNPVLQAWAALALAAARGAPLALPLVAVAAASLSRALIGFLQDRLVGGLRLPAATYLSLLVADLGALAFVPLALRRTVRWRGKVYRLSPGGRAEVVGNC
ncbi:MAG TPA: glycosyltransferase [Elusimicrobiota bacterium]|nr:glycosyltransferase [Elusimicrobiota bacterium]